MHGSRSEPVPGVSIVHAKSPLGLNCVVETMQSQLGDKVCMYHNPSLDRGDIDPEWTGKGVYPPPPERGAVGGGPEQLTSVKKGIP